MLHFNLTSPKIQGVRVFNETVLFKQEENGHREGFSEFADFNQVEPICGYLGPD